MRWASAYPHKAEHRPCPSLSELLFEELLNTGLVLFCGQGLSNLCLRMPLPMFALRVADTMTLADRLCDKSE